MTSAALLAALDKIHRRLDTLESRLEALESRREPKQRVVLQKSYDGASGELVSAPVLAEKQKPAAPRRFPKVPVARRSSVPHAKIKRTPFSDPVVSRFLVVGAESSGKWSLLRQMLSLCERFPAKFRRCDSFWTEKPLGRPSSLELRRSVLHSALRIVRDLAQHQIRYSSAETTVAASELLEACDGGADSSELEALRRRLLCLVRDATFQEAKESGEHKCSFDGSVHFLTEEGITRVFDEQRTLKWSDVAESNLKLKDDDVFFFRIRDKRFEITVLDDVDVDALPSAIDSWIEAASVPKTRVHVLYAASLYDVALPLRSGPATTHFDLTLAHFSRCLKSVRLAQCPVLIYFTNKHRLEAKLQASAFRATLEAFFQKEFVAGASGGKTDAFLAAFAARFSERISAAPRFQKNVYHRFTSISDAQLLDGLLAAVKDQIVSDCLAESALV